MKDADKIALELYHKEQNVKRWNGIVQSVQQLHVAFVKEHGVVPTHILFPLSFKDEFFTLANEVRFIEPPVDTPALKFQNLYVVWGDVPFARVALV